MGLMEMVYDLLDFDPVVHKAQTMARAGNVDEAIKLVKSTLDAKGPSSQRFDVLGWLYLRKGDAAEALSACDRAVELGKGKAHYGATRAWALRRLGRLEEALPLMQAQFKKNKMDIFNSAELCELLVDMGRNDEAATIYQDMHKRFDHEADGELAKQIGMTDVYRQAQQRLSRAGVI